MKLVQINPVVEVSVYLKGLLHDTNIFFNLVTVYLDSLIGRLHVANNGLGKLTKNICSVESADSCLATILNKMSTCSHPINHSRGAISLLCYK